MAGTSTNPFQYTGRENDGTGLYYYRARYYSPRLQRFVSEDPLNIQRLRLSIQKNNIEGLPAYYVMQSHLHHPELLNSYGYVANNPLTRIDPRGLWYIDVTGFSGGLMGGIQIGSGGVFLTGGGGTGGGTGLSITINSGSPSTGVGVSIAGSVGIGGGILGLGGHLDGGITGDVTVVPQEGPHGPGADVGLDISGDVSGGIGLGIGTGFSRGITITTCLFGPKC